MIRLRGRLVGLALAALLPAAPVFAQAGADPSVSIRPYVLVSAETFSASKSFDAVFGTTRGTFLGGGGQVTLGRFFVDVGASRFEETGERAFAVDDHVFRLGVPVTVTITPLEFSAGYRARLRSVPWLVPYAGAGAGTYRYEETSAFAADDENLDARATGFLVYGGAEFRLSRWMGMSVDASYASVGGILGEEGLSGHFAEDNLGGVAARLRVIVGR